MNSSRLVNGIMDAQSWPPAEVKTESFYVLTLSDVNNKNLSTTANPGAVRYIQWIWIIVGKDIAPGSKVRGANRGDRFVIQQTMEAELLCGLYPKYTEKKSWAMNSSGLWLGTSKTPPEFINWSFSKILKKVDKGSGLVYGTASVELVDMFDQIPA